MIILFAGCGGGGGSTSPTPSNPVPSITSIEPTSASAGGPAFTLTVNGSGFIASSVVRWNGDGRTTTFVSPTRLTAAIPASDIAAGGTAHVTVFNPSPGGGSSNSLTFSVLVTPSISSISPSTAIAWGPDLTITVEGSGFVQESQVLFDGHPITTSFLSTTRLTATVPAADIRVARTVEVAVNNPPFDLTQRSSVVLFPILNPTPQIASLRPSSAPAGSPDFILTVDGSNFVTDSVLRWNGVDRSTTPLSPTSLTASIPASDVAAVGIAQVTIFNGPPSGGLSDPATFTITPPALGRNDTRATATAISNGTIRASISPYADEDFYSFRAAAGATVTIEISARRLASPSQLDSVIEIQDSSGNRPSTCRSPDRPFNFTTFAEDDPTPGDFDDECVNDDIVTASIQDSRLEFQPASGGTYYVRVLDLRGDGRPDLVYELTLNGAD